MASENPSTTLGARWVFPVSRPPIPDGVVTCQAGRITFVGSRQDRRPDHDLGNLALIPGLVNAHTHLDLSHLRGLVPPSGDFPGWLRAVIGHRRAGSSEKTANAVRDGLAECINYGTTLVGDIAGLGASWEICAAAPLRAVVFYELLGLPPDRAGLARDAAELWLQSHYPTATCRPGLSPHAPYSVRASLFAEANRLADAQNAMLATHLAESPAELELLQTHTGPFVSFLQELGVWDSAGLSASPARVIRDCSDHNVRTLLIHANYLRSSTVIPNHATVVYCPRTHAAFGHAPYPLADFLRRGVRVALGTDSLASNPDLSVLSEARFVRERFSELSGETILRLATLQGAEALGFADVTGSLDVGKSADLVAIELPDEEASDPHELLLRGSGRVASVIFRGQFTKPIAR